MIEGAELTIARAPEKMTSSLRFPEELLQPPRCLVAVSGLDVRNNAVHRAVWDEFTQGGRRSERKPVLYRNMPPEHLYPKTSEPVRRMPCAKTRRTITYKLVFYPRPLYLTLGSKVNDTDCTRERNPHTHIRRPTATPH